jgi:hypothetical protein
MGAFSFLFSNNAILDFARHPGKYYRADNPARANRNFTPFYSHNGLLGAVTEDGPKVITADATLDDSYSYFEVDASGGNVVLTLPQATNYRVGFNTFWINRIDGSANTVTIQRNTNGSVNGANSVTHPGRWKVMLVTLVQNGGSDTTGTWRAWSSA